jgi:ethanolamine utilization protein EutA
VHVHFPDHHGADEPGEDDGDSLTWQLDNVELVTVGVDIGSSTSHLLFGRVHLQRQAQSLSSRYQVVRREVLHRSPILLTPFRADGLIDVALLDGFVEESYREAGLTPGEVDTGAVILTGVALEKANARAVAELFASRAGDFVCASAGHNLEAILAAHGSGAVARSRGQPGLALHVDVGGGTSKLALIEDGSVVATTATEVGGRLVVIDQTGHVVRVEPAALAAAADIGIRLEVGCPLASEERRALAARLAGVLLEAAAGEVTSALGRELQLGEELPETAGAVQTWSGSGGVMEYVAGRETATYGDIAPELAAAVALACDARAVSLAPVPEGIRATAMGASQFTVQLSGNTVHLPERPFLPVHNLPVVRVRLAEGALQASQVARAVAAGFRRLDIEEGSRPVALAIAWQGDPHYRELRALADGLAMALPRSLARSLPLVIACESDIGRSLGGIMAGELGVRADVLAIDGLQLLELDYIDLGRVLQPAGVVPVVIKSLAFAD